ncbi:sodium:solute symporter [Domibacillus iocasae]|uniref:Sodium:solute symporter n=1 Tax=Domibacillus iocasae TaxID=1714016 RepID=A0A1E7DNZ2_9BACI|nr:sodium:solute symporter [Domibacillus iocasae]OES44802.1 sodium:solute symporter [Domibacillus iocasae]
MHFVDVVVMTAYFIALIVVGIIGARRAKTSEDYIVAGRSLGFTMYLACLAAVILGGASTIGTARLGYEFGLSGFWLVAMLGLGILAIGLFLTKKISNLKVLTISEMLHDRFGAQTGLVSAVVAAIYAMMVSVTQVIGMGTILNVLLGWDLTLSMITGGGIVLFYTMLGGMWSVTMTDIVQFVVMTVGIFFIMLPMSLSKAGGWSSLEAGLPEAHFDFTSIGAGTIFQYFLLFCLGMVVAQDIWQRVFTAKTDKVARVGTIGAGLYSFAYALAVSVIGMCALIVVPNLGDTQTAFASMAIETLPAGILGFVLASVVSALMSTASGTLLASSTLIVNDIIKRQFMKEMNDKMFLFVSRVTTFMIGFITIIFALWIQDVLVALDVAYAVLSGAVFFPVIAGFFWKRATTRAAFYSITLSTIVILSGLAVKGITSTDPILYGLLTSAVVLVAVTYMTSEQKQNTSVIETDENRTGKII